MAHRRLTSDPRGGGNSLAGPKLSRSNGGNIKDKISLWEGKEPPVGHGAGNKRTESPLKSIGKTADERGSENCGRAAREKENPGREREDSRPCSPGDAGKQQRGTQKSCKPGENRGGWDDVGALQRQDLKKEIVEKVVDSKVGDSRPCSHVEAGKQQRSDDVGVVRKEEREKDDAEELRDSRPRSPTLAFEQQVATPRRGDDGRPAGQEKRAVFTLFKNLEATGEGPGKTPAELGNYFSPSKDRRTDARRKEVAGQTRGAEPAGDGGGKQPTGNGNAAAAAAINPVPKPQRTFQHPASDGRGQRNLPPLPAVSTKAPLRPTDDWRPGEERVQVNRKSFAFDDTAGSTRLLLPARSPSQEHHYEDILDSTKENPYEDVEVESQCSQQSLPSSPGAESKTSRPGFFRQNSAAGGFRLLDLRRTNQPPTLGGGTGGGGSGVPSPPRLSPLSTPAGSEHTSWPPGDPYSRTCHRIPTVVLRINSIFEARVGKKHLRRIYHYAETSSGRVTDENSDSESEVEDRLKGRPAHRRCPASRVGPPAARQAQGRRGRTGAAGSSPDPEPRQRRLFEYFLVVSLQRSRGGGRCLPEVTQQFPLKLERSFKFMREPEDQLKIIPQFCFPDATDWEPVESHPSETFAFVLTGEDGSRRFGYCRRLLPSGRGRRLPEVYCIVSHLGCFNLFSKVLDEVERRRALSPALVQPFLRAIMEAQFPAPGRTITIKTFLPGSGTEVMELCRPPDSRLEHVDFECLFSCLSLRPLLRVFGSLLLERRVIFTADKLSTLSQCCHAVVALLYPFAWQHTYVPVLPPAMLDVVCTPTPFIVGLLSGSLPRLAELPLEEVLVVDLGNSRFLRQLDDEDSILPSKLLSALENVLERRRELANERGGDTPTDSGHLSTVVSEAFVRFFVELVGHYPLFVVGEREDGYSSSSSSSAAPCFSFRPEGFRKAIPSKTVRRFLEAFMETQMFSWFVQERELRRQALKGLFEVRVQEYLESIHDNEHRRVNRFLKGLGNKMKFLSKK